MLNFKTTLDTVSDGASWLAANNDGELHLITYSKHNNVFYKGVYSEKVYEYEYCLFCQVNGDDYD